MHDVLGCFGVFAREDSLRGGCGDHCRPVRIQRRRPAEGALCRSCMLTRIRPSDADGAALAAFANAENAKRRLIVQLGELGLPITSRSDDPAPDLAFDMLFSPSSTARADYANGVITVDLTEEDAAHRTEWRTDTHEAHNGLLGNFRREVGRSTSAGLSPRRRSVWPASGRYSAIPIPIPMPAGMRMARTLSRTGPQSFAHYIRDDLDTLAAFSFASAAVTYGRRFVGPRGFNAIVNSWRLIVFALNMVNRSLGRPDVRPGVIESADLDKMCFVHSVADGLASRPQPLLSSLPA